LGGRFDCAIAEGHTLKNQFYCKASDDTKEEKKPDTEKMERDIETACCKLASANNIMHYKMETKGVRGWPDRLFLGPDGWHFFTEFKAPGKKPSPKQVARIEKLIESGHDVWVIDNVDDFDRALRAEMAAREL
jgi:hypothetical protein